MKLVATINSEFKKPVRKMGNGFINIEVRNEKKRLIGLIEIRPAVDESAKIKVMTPPDVRVFTNNPLKPTCNACHDINIEGCAYCDSEGN